ncbi:N-acyl homoserine lactonase family protein [Sphingomonas sp. BN140010]|uniref:N-acyl homoserine lactonase family protein n=1 Tax=Sphingomonas arvum TaxID=2992113 RepID=A0ABT3JHN8_9SPHN|nr:N-acyl homoserine lactonase family protein [Sphingomonas sp. BN140010]MCW3798250.1 N-acyl homoserine lactonase family protein [Sphingomonas sp. BN140010]
MKSFLVPLAVLALAGCGEKAATPANEAAANAAAPAAAAPAATKAAAPVSLSRLDCGKIHVLNMDKSFASGAGVYPPGAYDLTDSCYLIRHGDRMMIWDTGFPDAMVGHPYTEPGQQTATLDRSLVDQLAAGGVRPEQVGLIGISHYHADHVGQAHAFPDATLLIGAADLAALKGPKKDPFFQMSQSALKPWLTGGRQVEAVQGNKDVFGDGSVVMLDLPGHTPGHHSLLVKLASGNVLLSGDLYHGAPARTKRGMPPFNTDKAQTLESMDKFEALAKQMGATVVIQHEPADIAKVPAFPEAAR